MHDWQLQEAKAKFSQVVQESLTEGPQQITVRGKPSVVVMSRADYDKLTQPKMTFGKFMRKSPLVGVSLDLKRDQSKNRDIKL